MLYKTITFYKFVNIMKPEELVGYFRGLCVALDIKGKKLNGRRGNKARVPGKIKDIEKFKTKLKENKKFQDLTFRDLNVKENSYHKLVVKSRDEIITLGKKVDM